MGIGNLSLNEYLIAPSCQAAGKPYPTASISEQVNSEYIGGTLFIVSGVAAVLLDINFPIAVVGYLVYVWVIPCL